MCEKTKNLAVIIKQKNHTNLLTLKNYKNFKDEISIDFENTAGYQFSTDCITDGMISKILIYGRNATGKTNLGKALIDIYTRLFGGRRYADTGIFLNADSIDETATIPIKLIYSNFPH